MIGYLKELMTFLITVLFLFINIDLLTSTELLTYVSYLSINY